MSDIMNKPETTTEITRTYEVKTKQIAIGYGGVMANLDTRIYSYYNISVADTYVCVFELFQKIEKVINYHREMGINKRLKFYIYLRSNIDISMELEPPTVIEEDKLHEGKIKIFRLEYTDRENCELHEYFTEDLKKPKKYRVDKVTAEITVSKEYQVIVELDEYGNSKSDADVILNEDYGDRLVEDLQNEIDYDSDIELSTDVNYTEHDFESIKNNYEDAINYNEVDEDDEEDED